MALAVEFMPVGKSDGDAIMVRWGDQFSSRLNLTDGGYYAVGEELIEHIENHYGANAKIDNMIVSHADNDHAAGLIPIFKRFQVGALWMNRPWLYASEIIDQFHGNWTIDGWVNHVRDKHEYLVELEDLARGRGMEPKEVFQGAVIGESIVLAPSRARYLELIPDLDKTPPPYRSEVLAKAAGLLEYAKRFVDGLMETLDIETLEANPPATSASNETSVVQLVSYDGHKVLLTADAGPKALEEAGNFAKLLGMLSPPDVVQIPHQGSRRNVTPAVLDLWLGEKNGGVMKRGGAVVLVGSQKPDHPRKKVANAFTRRGYPVFVGRSDWIRNNWGFEDRGSPMTAEPFHELVEDE